MDDQNLFFQRIADPLPNFFAKHPELELDWLKRMEIIATRVLLKI